MISLWLVMGGALGLLNGLTRWWTVARIQPDMRTSALLLTLGGMVIRLALASSLLIAGLSRGIVSGLLAFGGLWLARSIMAIWTQSADISWRPPVPGGTSVGRRR